MILLVEADGQHCTILEQVLCRNGFPVRTARHAYEAMMLARECRPRLMLVAEELGDVSPHEMRAMMRVDPQLRDLPVIVYKRGDDTDDLLDQVEHAHHDAPPVIGEHSMPLTYRPFARL